MTDPVSGGIGKASQQMMQELQKQMEQNQGVGKNGGAGQFNDVMAQQGVQNPQQVNPAMDPSKVNETQKAADVLRTAQSQQVGGVDKSLQVKTVEGVKETGHGGGLKAVLNQVVDGQNKLDQIIKMATSGKVYGNQELLAVQAAVYKFSQELDLTSKVVEKATSGVKQTMQTQV
jgi:hypothetical protein